MFHGGQWESRDEVGQLDCLINNAGVFDTQGPWKSKDGSMEYTFMVNVFAPFLIT